MPMERFKTIVGILLAVGIIFGTFAEWTQTTVTFGWAWFAKMLWFAIGFPVLFGLGWIVFSLLIAGEKEAEKHVET